MNAKKFSDAMSELDSKYVDEAINYKKKAQKSVWVKRGGYGCLPMSYSSRWIRDKLGVV